MLQKEKSDKLVEQLKYKQMLDQQIKFNKEARMYGNMTQVEKRMNHHELYAYKNNDNNPYSLIPGFNTTKKEPHAKMIKQHKPYDSMDRLRKSGFSRDVRDVRY